MSLNDPINDRARGRFIAVVIGNDTPTFARYSDFRTTQIRQPLRENPPFHLKQT